MLTILLECVCIDWDVNKWLWQGALKVTCKGDTMFIILFDASTNELFATCPVTEKKSKAVDQVIDSSRYFALRIDDGKGKHAFVGMGFRDRDDAYSFKATMEDHWKSVQREKEAEEYFAEIEARAASEPMRDLSLKDGEKLSIKVNVPGSGKPKKARAPSAPGTGFLPPPPGGGLLAPPPKAGAAVASAPPAPPTQRDVPPAAGAPPAAPPPTAGAGADDDFGDFGSFEGGSAGGGNDDDDDFGDFSSAGS